MSDCGTYAGYQRHMRRAEPVDPACREAQRQYNANWRAADPDRSRRAATYNRARHRALERLRERHPGEFAELLRQERRAEP